MISFHWSHLRVWKKQTKMKIGYKDIKKEKKRKNKESIGSVMEDKKEQDY